MLRSSFAAVFLVASLAACEPAEEATPAPVETAVEDATVPVPTPTPLAARADAEPDSDEATDNGCGADKLDRWLNVLPTDDVKREIAATVGERPIRYYTQGDPITMDFSPSRLNVELGEDGRIKLFRCG